MARSIGLYGVTISWLAHLLLKQAGSEAPGAGLTIAAFATGNAAVFFLEVFAIASASLAASRGARAAFVLLALLPLFAAVDILLTAP